MSAHQIVSFFVKSGPWCQHARRWHNLSDAAKRRVVALIQGGTEVEKALKAAKREK